MSKAAKIWNKKRRNVLESIRSGRFESGFASFRKGSNRSHVAETDMKAISNIRPGKTILRIIASRSEDGKRLGRTIFYADGVALSLREDGALFRLLPDGNLEPIMIGDKNG